MFISVMRIFIALMLLSASPSVQGQCHFRPEFITLNTGMESNGQFWNVTTLEHTHTSAVCITKFAQDENTDLRFAQINISEELLQLIGDSPRAILKDTYPSMGKFISYLPNIKFSEVFHTFVDSIEKQDSLSLAIVKTMLVVTNVFRRDPEIVSQPSAFNYDALCDMFERVYREIEFLKGKKVDTSDLRGICPAVIQFFIDPILNGVHAASENAEALLEEHVSNNRRIVNGLNKKYLSVTKLQTVPPHRDLFYMIYPSATDPSENGSVSHGCTAALVKVLQEGTVLNLAIYRKFFDGATVCEGSLLTKDIREAWEKVMESVHIRAPMPSPLTLDEDKLLKLADLDFQALTADPMKVVVGVHGETYSLSDADAVQEGDSNSYSVVFQGTSSDVPPATVECAVPSPFQEEVVPSEVEASASETAAPEAPRSDLSDVEENE